MKKKLVLLMAAMMTAIILAACGSDEGDTGSDGESGDNVLKVGMEANYAPFNWTQKDDSNGAVKIDGSPEYAGGYDVEIAKKIAEGNALHLFLKIAIDHF